jgi:CxxC-x17-CxxC domain-containing protein
MGKFDRGGFGGGKKFGGRDRSFDRNAPREMHKAVCAECGDQCEVPFKPSGDRPVLCSNCFKSSRGEERGEGRREERRDFDRPRHEDRQMFDATCAKCGQPCQIPFRPKPGRDIFCSDCFARESGETKSFSSDRAPKSANYDKQFEILNSRLNKIIELLSPSFAKASEGKPKEAVDKIQVKKVEEKKSVSTKVPADKAGSKVEKKSEKKSSAKKNISKKK